MDVTMHAEHNKQSHQGPDVEFLARESHVSIDEVARLYGKELAKLQIGARIQGFLPILAIRNVREMLRQRKVGLRPLAKAA